MGRQFRRPRLKELSHFLDGFHFLQCGLMRHGGSLPRRFAHADVAPARPSNPADSRSSSLPNLSDINGTDRLPSCFRKAPHPARFLIQEGTDSR